MNMRQNKNYEEKGITLVALVITIIIIIILSTITLNMVFGDNGLIKQAQKAKDMTANSIASEQEGMNSVMSEYLNLMEEDSEIPVPEPPDIPGGSEAVEQGAITFTNLKWENGQASVTIGTNTSYTLQYQVVANEGLSNELNWKEVPEGGSISNLNHLDVVYARLVQGTNHGEEASTTIKDGTPPTISNISLTSTENSVTVTVTASDGESGIGNYTYTINGGSQTSNTTGSYTFTGLSASTTYTIGVTVIDKANNPVTENKSIQTKEPPSIPESTSYAGYYADVDGNGSVDGIIYADLAIGGSGQWGLNDTYSIPKQSNLKKYKEEGTYTANGFGTKGVIKPNGESGNERFYVMALSDADTRNYCWYYSAYGKMNDYATTTSVYFGSGEQNTINMRAKWNSSDYGSQNGNSTYADMWGLITVQNGAWNGSNGWYVPSKEEWLAFGDTFNITKSNYSNYDLSSCYWSSSQYDNSYAWTTDFSVGYMGYGYVYYSHFVRLGTTF